MIYEVKGKFKEKGVFKPFTRKVNANSEKLAEEKLKCLFGSEHKIKRRHVIVEKIKKAEVN